MTQTSLRSIAALAAIGLAALACGTFDNLVEGGQSAAATAEALATEIESSGLAVTAQALATEAASGGLAATAEAMATEAGGSGFTATAEAVATEGFVMGQAPEDVPVYEGEKSLFFGSEEVVSYFVSARYADVVDFYKDQMPANEWVYDGSFSVETEDAAVLYYSKTDRTAIVTISRDSSDNTVSVQIVIQPR